EVFAEWAEGLMAAARYPNIYLKISGIGVTRLGIDYPGATPEGRTSTDIAEAAGVLVRRAVEIFGAERSIFGSNYPVDRHVSSYRTLLNAYKRMLGDLPYSALEAIFWKNAAAVYRL